MKKFPVTVEVRVGDLSLEMFVSEDASRWSQASLAEECGIAAQSAASALLRDCARIMASRAKEAMRTAIAG